jgi:hypothetical protein
VIDIKEKLRLASIALDKNDISEVNRFINELENELIIIQDKDLASFIKANLGGLLIDLGSAEKNEPKIIRGISYAEEYSARSPSVLSFYNTANGFNSLWDLRKTNEFINGRLDNSLEKAKMYFRKAIEISKETSKNYQNDLYEQVLVNYANCFDSVSRSVEAVSQYDNVIKRNNKMGMALGNKGITLIRLAPLSFGFTHTFYLEAYRLLTEALKNPLPLLAKNSFNKNRILVEKIIRKHNGLKPERIQNLKPINEFHVFLREYCHKNDLYLTPTTLIGSKKSAIYGDPMYISKMVAPIADKTKFDRYITFLDQIKQDYILARYLLVQSQYKSEFVDSIDEGVVLYYPLDYSLYSSYIQMLKTSFRLAVDLLDKIASFISDYYQVNSISKTYVNFRNLFSCSQTPYELRSEFAIRKNPYIFALFDLSLDLRKNGDFKYIYERRNALTHRFLVIHDIVINQSTNDDIPREFLEDFIRECINTLQITRAAVMYLIMMVDYEENSSGERGQSLPITGTLVDGVFRWVPRN